MASRSSIPIAGSRRVTPTRCARGPRNRMRAPRPGSARFRRVAPSVRACSSCLASVCSARPRRRAAGTCTSGGTAAPTSRSCTCATGSRGPTGSRSIPTRFPPTGTTALDWYHVSPDGRLLAYGLSANGSEQSVLHLLDLDTLTPLTDQIPHTRSCDLAWLPDAFGLLLHPLSRPGDRRRRVRSSTIAPSGSTGWGTIPPPIAWSSSRRARSTGPAFRCPMTDGGC